MEGMRSLVLLAAVTALVTGCSAPAALPTEPAAVSTAEASASPEAGADGAAASTAEPAAASAPPTASVSASPAAPALDVDAPTSLTVVVNKQRPLDPPDYAPELVPVSTAQEGGETVRPEVDAALARLDAAMRAAIGEGTYVTSSYRSAALQAQYYQDAIGRYGQVAADTTSARPGHSEHQTGLAIDLMSTAMQCRLAHCFGETAAGRWIAEHAWESGFIVRYPEGQDAWTGYAWEPWHLRYIGVEAAAAMHASGAATLEEFAGLPPAPGYGP